MANAGGGEEDSRSWREANNELEVFEYEVATKVRIIGPKSGCCTWNDGDVSGVCMFLGHGLWSKVEGATGVDAVRWKCGLDVGMVFADSLNLFLQVAVDFGKMSGKGLLFVTAR